ncbi:Trk-type K+ transport system membrane component [Neolewinella xylanilytica]|uniref:Trk-type K+ transport system membrane component n=1 Tax=Neolewinella xylanilytica TaxID=1514080 RepID=A0A2S6I4M2_9BACT|nr:potassium transporter TrkG [Neolewinella xylanilytica]PPK86039.1 Trk-type K+ transport system membrane component [Neolewinella xylanilytica]
MHFNRQFLYRTALWASLLGVAAFVVDFGFDQTRLTQQIFDGFYFLVIALGLASTFFRYFGNSSLLQRRVFAFDALSVGYTLYIFYMYLFVGQAFETDLILENPVWVVAAVILTFFREFFSLRLSLNQTYLNPAQLFIFSFLAIIFTGSLLLMLPNAANQPISFLDALFTSTSAVCVTGLIVVDTATFFTRFGQSIILVLIQVGGLGILTFASYFSYFFKGASTYENQLTISEMTNSDKIGEVFQTLKQILLITLTVEAVSAFFIFLSLGGGTFPSFVERAYFSVFHAVSAFCNAGFSTLSNGLYEEPFRVNYGMQLIIIATFVLGGLGFPIVVNLLKYFRYKLAQLLFRRTDPVRHRPWLLNLNSRINLVTTASLFTIGFLAYFILEYDATLADRTPFGKVVTALFGGATPRTAGFNTVDMTALTFPTVMLTYLLMWIGASPASTGGGIKTSTIAIAVLNFFSLAKGKERIEVFRREIAGISVKRAFATISLSLLVIGLAILLIAIFDPEKNLINIGFECFSAYSTVGLSLGITGQLSAQSKLVIIAVMFIGRVSMLSILIATFRKTRHKNYRYPTEELTIN